MTPAPTRRMRQEMRDWTQRDRRITTICRTENGNISVATNQGALAARGEFIVFVDHDDLLDHDALAHLCIISMPIPRPNWSTVTMTRSGRMACIIPLNSSRAGHLSYFYRSVTLPIYRRWRAASFAPLVGFESGLKGRRIMTFGCGQVNGPRALGTLPRVLYHWRVLPGSTALDGACKPSSFEAGRRAVEEAFHRRGVPCRVEQTGWAKRAACAVFEPVMPDDGPSVAILIPTRNHEFRLKKLLDSLAATTYRNYQVYVIDNASDEAGTLSFLAALPHKVMRVPNPGTTFNFAAINNTAAAAVTEELLLFLNDDVEVSSPRWLSQMVGWSRLPGVGAVGARLLYPDQSVQHVGVVHGLHDAVVGHAFRHLPRGEPGYWNLDRVTRDCIAVTAACLLTPRKLFLELGGFDTERFPVAYNDVDYGYRLADAGFRSVCCARPCSFTTRGSHADGLTILVTWPYSGEFTAGGLILTSVSTSIPSRKSSSLGRQSSRLPATTALSRCWRSFIV